MLVRYGIDKNGVRVKKALIYTAKEHNIDTKLVDPDAIYIINRLLDYGFHSYIVGGAVRDLLTGHTPKDFDIVTTATPIRIKRLFSSSYIIGRRFRIVHIIIHNKVFEVTTFRALIEGVTTGNDFGSMEEDVMRRDFTLNALYLDVMENQVIDYVGGVRDIRKHLLRPVIPLDKIFEEDSVRIIRALKYAVKTQSKMQHALIQRIKASAYLLEEVSKSRLTEEFIKILNSGFAQKIITLMCDLGVYKYIQPNCYSLLVSDKEYCDKYIKALGKIDDIVSKGGEVKEGEKFTYLLKDYIVRVLEGIGIQNKARGIIFYNEIYSIIFFECKKFLSPLTPARQQVEVAVKAVLKELNICSRLQKLLDISFSNIRVNAGV